VTLDPVPPDGVLCPEAGAPGGTEADLSAHITPRSDLGVALAALWLGLGGAALYAFAQSGYAALPDVPLDVPVYLVQGIRIFEWNDSVMHNKSAVVDDRWCTIGTYNLDYRSWLFNLEVNVGIEDTAVAYRLRCRLDEDFEVATRIELAQWRYRPLLERLLERFFYLFRKLL
jgi:phosphatidylserine/phosphatidylglycerophosphate/cardiolipin synthase-like enzyme